MKIKLTVFCGFILLGCSASFTQADSLYAYEYSTNYPHPPRQNNNDDDWYRSNKDRSSIQQQRQYQQQPQLYIYPNIEHRNSQRHYLQQREQEHEEREWLEHKWREHERDERRRRMDLERQPRSTYEENQFYRDDTHW